MMVLLGVLTEMQCTATHSMSAEEIWQRMFYDELKLEKITQDSFCTAHWKWLVNSEASSLSMQTHLASSHTGRLDCTGLVWCQRTGGIHTSSCKMCRVSGGPAWGNETKAVKKTIWDNQLKHTCCYLRYVATTFAEFSSHLAAAEGTETESVAHWQILSHSSRCMCIFASSKASIAQSQAPWCRWAFWAHHCCYWYVARAMLLLLDFKLTCLSVVVCRQTYYMHRLVDHTSASLQAEMDTQGSAREQAGKTTIHSMIYLQRFSLRAWNSMSSGNFRITTWLALQNLMFCGGALQLRSRESDIGACSNDLSSQAPEVARCHWAVLHVCVMWFESQNAGSGDQQQQCK